MWIFTSIIVFILICFNNASIANDFDTALAAANKGDYETARRVWKPLAEHGDVLAEYNIGYMNYNGHGGAKNYKEALKWYTLSALHGNNVARYALGVIYESGDIVEKDYKLAAAWYQLAANEGYGKAQFNLGMIYIRDEIGNSKYNEGLKLIHDAAKSGQSKAHFNLGIFYRDGELLTKNDFKSYIWLTIASNDKNILNAITEKELVSKNLSPEQILNGEKIAIDCIQQKFKNCNF